MAVPQPEWIDHGGEITASLFFITKCLVKVQPEKIAIIHKLRDEIKRDWPKILTMETLAEKNHLSYPWFRKAFKEIIGLSPGQYQLNLKMEKATRMLRDSDTTISEIALCTGFSTEHHFSKFFKKKVLISPSKYRESFKARSLQHADQ